jgi:subtilisin family serine protease
VPSVELDELDVLTADVLFTEDADPRIASLPYAKDELLVQAYPGADRGALSSLYADVGGVVVEVLAEIDTTVLGVPVEAFDSIAKLLANSKLIETVQKNYETEANRTPNDPLFTYQGHLTQVHTDDAWDMTVGLKEIIVAIVDTGVDASHPDLEDRILTGWNVYDDNGDFDDVAGHGTLVAGVVAAASDNALGVAGMTWNCPILAVRATDESGRASARDVAAGILWALANDAKVINVSFAPLWSNRIVQAAAQEAFNRGSLVVISAGNGGGTTVSPGYDEALFVGAVTWTGGIASFSDRGPFVDLVAPGTAIQSTQQAGEYDMANGTSFAAPIVSGVAALAWSVNPDLRPVSVQSAILATAVDLGTRGEDDFYGLGLVDAAAAVEKAADTLYEWDWSPPTVRVSRPIEGAVLSGRDAARVTAVDPWGVADVVLSIDGVAYATDTRAPFRFVIDTAEFQTGSHELAFVATDLAGNTSGAETVTVTFRTSYYRASSDPSGIIFSAPHDGAEVSGDVQIQATVTDADGLATLEWFVDGDVALVNSVSGTSSGVAFLWRTDDVDPGRHSIMLVVTDAEGQQTAGQLELVVR